MKTYITLTEELSNLLTADYADYADEYTVEDLLQMIKTARESVEK